MFIDALLVGILCGTVGVLVDLDHIIAYLIGRAAIHGRFLHTPLLIVSGTVLLGLVAYLGRLLIG